MSISGRLLETIIRHANRDLSSFSSTTRSTVLTLITFPLLFHVCNLRFFTAQIWLYLLQTSWTIFSLFHSVEPDLSSSFRTQISSWPDYKGRYLIQRYHQVKRGQCSSWLSASADGWVFFSLVVKAGSKSWWCSCASVIRPAIDLASVASLASSGAIRKNCVRALAFSMIPTSPPDTFTERFRCCRALSPLPHKMELPGSCLLPSCC